MERVNIAIRGRGSNSLKNPFTSGERSRQVVVVLLGENRKEGDTSGKKRKCVPERKK